MGKCVEVKKVLDEIGKAYNVVCDLCKPKGSKGSREWIMSIPAKPDYDPDLIISRALCNARKLILKLTEQAK